MHEDLSVSPEFKSASTEFVRQLPKVQLFERLEKGIRPDTAEEAADNFTRIAKEAVEDDAADGIVYTEITLTLGDPDEAQLHAVLEGLRQGESNSGTVARLLVGLSGSNALEVAELAIEHRGAVVGCVIEDAAALPATELLIANFMPFVVNCEGDVPIPQAVTRGATRLRQPIDLYEDFSVDVEGIHPGVASAYIRDREIALEFALSSAVEAELIDEIGDHPLPLMQQLGFTCALGIDSRKAAKSLSTELEVLVNGFDYGLEELFELTINALEKSFLPKGEREELMQQAVLPAYQRFADDEDAATAEDGE